MDGHLAGHRGRSDGGLAAVGEGRQLNVTQFVLEDGWVFRTREAHEHLSAMCKRFWRIPRRKRESQHIWEKEELSTAVMRQFWLD